ncbi:MAG: quinoprotein relay system zinc metallohydrolase 1 [Pseudomonadota bacterium]
MTRKSDIQGSDVTRRVALKAAVAVPALGMMTRAVPAAARQADFLVAVADGVWMHQGDTETFSRDNGGDIANVAVFATDDGALVVDAGSSRAFSEQLRAEVEIRCGGLAATILTHHHPDHTFGTQALADRPIIAQPATAAKVEANLVDYADLLYREVGLPMRGTEPVLPNQSIAPGLLTVGGRRFEVLALAGHTEADLALLDIATGTLVAGDLLFLDRAPTVPDADLATWHASLDRLAALAPAAAIPGHGPVDRRGAAVRQTRAYLDWLAARLADAADRGLGMIEAMHEAPPAEWAALGANPGEFRRSVVQTYAAYETEALPLLR